jgi:hypothetical protein
MLPTSPETLYSNLLITHTHETYWKKFLWLDQGICVHHEVLLAALHFYGIQGTGADWFRPYVIDRNQKV